MDEREREEHDRDLYLRRIYGITLAQYDQILEAQGGVCAVCGEPPKGLRLSVDHDHQTGIVRGLLCWFDNQKVIGRHRDGSRLRAAADYLDDPPALAVIGEVTVPKRKRRRRKKPQECELQLDVP